MLNGKVSQYPLRDIDTLRLRLRLTLLGKPQTPQKKGVRFCLKK